MIGQRISHYRITGPLGAGGMGVVYLARDETLDREVALKVLPAGSLATEAVRSRFRKEALALAKLNHPNIETIYEFDSEDGVDFLVTEYVPGSTLASRIAGGPLSEAEILDLALQIASALEEAEGKGLVHLDLKPRNMMLTPKGQVKLFDFGLAKIVRPGETEATQSITNASAIAGTPPYMAPEQLLGGVLDTRTDLYALGASLYELATGQLPFRGKTAPELIAAILHTPATPPSRERCELSPGLETVVLKCLEKDPAQRYQSVKELRIDLELLTSPERPELPDRALVTARPPLLAKARSHGWALGGSFFALAAAILLYWFTGSRPALSFPARDWVLVTEFTNQTNDPVFDQSLLTAFSVSIEQSRRVNVYPRVRILEVLARMKKPPGMKIDEAVGFEIAVREGIRALVIPSISGVGDNYRLAARIRDVVSGDDVRTTIVKAKGKDRVLDGLDQLAAKVRRDLGESLLAISRSNRPLATVTTASLEALKQYSIAIQKHGETNYREAKLYYENALSIDPRFTSAQASLGMLDFDLFDRKEGQRLLSEAVRNVDSLTDREKYWLLGLHALAVEKDLDKYVKYDKILIGLYPDYALAHYNLGNGYRMVGRYPEAVAEFKEALRIDPRLKIALQGLLYTHVMCMGDLDAAIEIGRAALMADGDQAGPHFWMGYAYCGKGRLEEGVRDLRRAVELDPQNPQTLNYRYDLAVAYLLEKRNPEAAEVLNGILAKDRRECQAYYFLGLVHDVEGDKASARSQWLRSIDCVQESLRGDPKNGSKRVELAIALTRLGQAREAEAEEQRALAMDANLHFDIARLRCAQGKTGEALDSLERAEKNLFQDFVWIKINPDLQSLAGQPRFVALLRRHLQGITADTADAR